MKLSKIKKTILILTVVTAAIVWGVVVSLSELKNEAIEGEIKLSKLYSKTFMDIVEQKIDSIVFLSDTIQGAIDNDGGFKNLENEFQKILTTSPFIRSINVLSPEKKVVFSSNEKNLDFFVDIDKFEPKPLFNKFITRFGNPNRGRDLFDGYEIVEPKTARVDSKHSSVWEDTLL